LLGGSFNPAHEGHRAISAEALRRLGLDEVWWLVSPQNPLKSSDGMEPQQFRAERAAAMTQNPRIRVTMLERELGTVYTAESLHLLVQRFPKTRFIWLMGADNLVQFDRWQDWEKIFNTIVVAVFDRPTYALRALAAVAARRFVRYRRRESDAKRLADQTPPAWVFLHNRLNAQSSTAMRAVQERADQSVRGTKRAPDKTTD
jgi:nicotinate-nucleotide adenylyltransferase